MGSMEEILERVQFKFASIIGELCGEPLVLSQFAIWVDMRLAEYKLKGCISLDCSGKKIEPDWLKSLKSLHPEPANPTTGLSEELSHDRYSKPPSVMGHSMRVLKRPNLQRKASMTTNSHIHTVSQGKKSAASSTITNDVISTTDMQGSEMTRTRTAIVIKNEPSEGEEDVMDLYPVSVHDNASLHRHGTGESMNIRTGALTIRQPESDQQAADDHFLHEGELGMKVRRLAGSSPPYNLSPSSVHESPSSQSLVSIIGAGVHVHDNNQDLNDTADSDMEILNTSQSNIGDFSERGDNCSTSTAMPGGRLSLETGERPDVNPVSSHVTVEELFLRHWRNLQQNRTTNSTSLPLEKYRERIQLLKSSGRCKDPTRSSFSTCERTVRSRFDIICVDGKEKLIKKKRNEFDTVRIYVADEHLYQELFNLHMSTGHGKLDTMREHVKEKYANVTKEAIKLFLSLCETCSCSKYMY